MINERMEARLQELRTDANDFAAAYAEQKYLEEYRKSLLAILMKKYEAVGFNQVTAQEREARADKEYVELLANLRTATEKSERLRWNLEVSKMGVAVWQTTQANERAERKVYGA